MLTRNELSERLEGLGIWRDARTLTKWVEQGLLPKPKPVGRGPDQGVARFWEDDVLQQAIAADYLMKLYHRADWVALGLWYCGYPVSTNAAKAAWLKYAQRDHEHLLKKAAEYRDGILGLSRSWGRRAPFIPSDHVAAMLDFMTEMTDWQHNDVERDDEAFKLRLAEILGWFEEPMFDSSAPNIQLVDGIDLVWKALNFPAFFRPAESIAFIQSTTEAEMSIAQRSLTEARETLENLFRLNNDENIALVTQIGPTRIMQGIVGPILTKLLIQLNREISENPVSRSISAIHECAMELKLGEISRKEEWQLKFSERARRQWRTTAKIIAEIWATALTEEPIR